MQVTETAHTPFGTLNFSLCCANVYRARCTYIFTINLFDTINWRQVPSKCEKRYEKHSVRVTLTTHKASRANEWIIIIVIIIALCVRVTVYTVSVRCVCTACRYSFGLIDTQIMVFIYPFCDDSVLFNFTLTTFFCVQNKPRKNVQRQTLDTDIL